MRILFLCTGNSARSQMAEGFARHLGPPGLEVWSAGVEPRGLHPLAVQVMGERGIDVSGQRSKGLESVPRDVDLVVTLCGDAADRCPAFPGATQRQHWELPDPAAVSGSDESILGAFRGVRDDIEARVRRLLASLETPAAP